MSEHDVLNALATEITSLKRRVGFLESLDAFGSSLAAVLKVLSGGVVQVANALYVGSLEGAKAGLWNLTDDAGNPSRVMQTAAADNVPMFSAGAAEGSDPDLAWCNIGRADGPRIHTERMTGYAHKVPIVDGALVVLTTPDGLHTYQLAISNAGALTTTKLT